MKDSRFYQLESIAKDFVHYGENEKRHSERDEEAFLLPGLVYPGDLYVEEFR